jgi:hypothetical protein
MANQAAQRVRSSACGNRGGSAKMRAMSGNHPIEPEPEEPHDILAAEAFAMGERDPALHREPAHDVLAAEEFALPAPAHHAVPPGYPPSGAAGREGDGRGRWVVAGAALLAGVFLRRRRRRA